MLAWQHAWQIDEFAAMGTHLVISQLLDGIKQQVRIQLAGCELVHISSRQLQQPLQQHDQVVSCPCHCPVSLTTARIFKSSMLDQLCQSKSCWRSKDSDHPTNSGLKGAQSALKATKQSAEQQVAWHSASLKPCQVGAIFSSRRDGLAAEGWLRQASKDRNASSIACAPA